MRDRPGGLGGRPPVRPPNRVRDPGCNRVCEASGRGTLYTSSVVHQNDLPPFNERLPYVAAIVELDEGPRAMTNIVDCDLEALRVGMAVEVEFRAISEDVSIPVFRPGAA